MNRRFAYKLLFYSLFLFYLIGDLYWWHGFLARRLDDHFRPDLAAPGDDSEIVYMVYGEPITRNQILRKKAEIAFQRGMKPDESGAFSKNQDQTLDAAAKVALMHQTILRIKASYSGNRIPDVAQDARREVKLMASRFDDGGISFADALAREHTDVLQWTSMTDARLRQTALLDDFAVGVAPVSEEDLKVYYERIREQMRVPEHRQLSHIFLAKLDKDPADVSRRATALLAELEQGADFSDLARRASEDEASAPKGGDLGLVSRGRIPPGIDVDLFSLPQGRPVLAESRLGFHLFKAGPVVPEREARWEEVRPVVKSALESIRRDRAVSLYFDEVLREARQSRSIREGRRR